LPRIKRHLLYMEAQYSKEITCISIDGLTLFGTTYTSHSARNISLYNKSEWIFVCLLKLESSFSQQMFQVLRPILKSSVTYLEYLQNLMWRGFSQPTIILKLDPIHLKNIFKFFISCVIYVYFQPFYIFIVIVLI